MTSHEKQKSTRIDRRDDVNPHEGEHKYGDVEFADPVNNKYPVDTPEHVRARPDGQTQERVPVPKYKLRLTIRGRCHNSLFLGPGTEL